MKKNLDKDKELNYNKIKKESETKNMQTIEQKKELQKEITKMQATITDVNDSVLMSLSRNSKDPIYKDAMPDVIDKFESAFPNTKAQNVLTMRCLLAKDVEKVKTKTNRYCLMLTTDIEKLDTLNVLTKLYNRIVRYENKVCQLDMKAKLTTNGEMDYKKVVNALKEMTV